MSDLKQPDTDGSVSAEPNGATAHLVRKIKGELKECEKHSRLAVEHMLRLGDLLVQAKKTLGHGEFYPWLKQKCDLGQRQAQRYMKVARHREIVEKANASRATHLSLTAALAAIEKELAGTDTTPPKDGEGQDALERDYDAELDRHKKRCEEFQRFLQDETSITAGPALRRGVKEDINKVILDMIAVARRHGKKLTTKKLKGLGSDQDLVAMVLLAEAKGRIDPINDFAPKEPTQTAS